MTYEYMVLLNELHEREQEESEDFLQEVGVAQAIYDNQAEWPDELAFERGEILRVLNERPCANGSGVGINTGWWCCINKDGRRGIVPANRLRMLHRFDHRNSTPQESATPPFTSVNSSGSRRRFMFGGPGRVTSPFIDDDDFLNGVASPITNELLSSPSFDSGSLFDRIFPLSPLERFKNTSLRHMSNGSVGSPPHGVVRNIPIKVEGVTSNNSGGGFDKVRSSSVNFTSDRYHNDEPPPPALSFYRRRFVSGHISPPPPAQRKFPNPSTSSLSATAGPSSSSNEPASSSDEDRIRPKGIEKSDSIISRTSNRPVLAPKPKLDDQNSSTPINDEKGGLERLQRPKRISSNGDSIDNVSWRLQKMGTTPLDDSSPKYAPNKGFTPKGHGLHWPAHLESSVAGAGAQGASSSNESESGSVIVNTSTVPHDEPGSSSPSSSGIVADMNDSNGESNQRTSATSSLSSCEPSSDLIESNYDTPRPGRTYRPRVDDPLAAAMQDHHHQQQTSLYGGVAAVPQRAQLARIREPTGLLMPTLEEKAEPSSTSVLQNVFNGLADSSNASGAAMNDDDEPKFNLSLNLSNRRSFTPRLNRSPSIPHENMYAKYNLEDRFRHGESAAPELTTRYRSLDSGVSSLSNEENTTRKQTVCSKLTENYRHIESGVEKLDQCTAARAWRQPHILQQHILDIKENVEAIANAMNSFLDAACRIAVDVNNPKAEELNQLLAPLKNSNTMITQLKQNLDSTGWTLGALSRPRNIYGTTPGSDALDQFLAVIKQLPTDCYKLIQWALVLVPSSGVRFLTTGLRDSLSADNITSSIYQPDSDSLLRLGVIDGNGPTGTDSKRQSTVSTASSMTISSLNDIQAPAPILATRTTLNPTNAPMVNGKQNRVTFADNLSTTHRLSNLNLEGHVLEEDDLESVISDRDSYCQDSAIGGEDAGASRRRRPVTSLPPVSQISAEVIKSLSEDDRQLVEFYSPQLDAHTEFLSKAIEEFLTVIEERMPPNEFVQKGKLIILTAHKLIYMADTIAECLSSTELSNEVKRAADRLLDVLKTCVQATKHAADEYLSVTAVQSMANCIVTVSRAAYDLKLLVKQCCNNSQL